MNRTFSPLKTGILGLTLSVLLASCSDSIDSSAGEDFDLGTDSNNGNTTEFNESLLLNDLVELVLSPAISSFSSESQSLSENVSAYCDSLATSTAEEQLTSAKQQWRQTMASWQQIEVMQIGPLLDNDATLRNAIYSWPVTSQCAVDQDVGYFEAGNINGVDYDISRRTNTRRGLDALEYLLFNNDINHSCSRDSLAPANWNERPEQERKIARCSFAKEVAIDISNSATSLVNLWSGDNGFAKVLKSAGAEQSEFASTHDAVNRITDAMFYLDSITKDLKLAAPIGLATNSCGTASCVQDLESNLSDNALANIKSNLIAMQSLFLGAPLGTDAVGFDDYLVDVDASDLATTMAADIQAALDATDTFEGSMIDAVNNNPERIQTLHSAIKVVTDNLKSMFITYLSLELPLTSAGDAD